MQKIILILIVYFLVYTKRKLYVTIISKYLYMPGKAERKNMERKTELLKMTVAGGLSDLARDYDINIKRMSKCAIVDAILDYEDKNGKKKKIATKNTINTKLKAMRIRSGLTQREVAEKIGMNIKLYAQYEQGTKSFDSVNLRVMLTVCLALGCRIEEVIESEDILQLINQYENG